MVIIAMGRLGLNRIDVECEILCRVLVRLHGSENHIY